MEIGKKSKEAKVTVTSFTSARAGGDGDADGGGVLPGADADAGGFLPVRILGGALGPAEGEHREQFATQPQLHRDQD